MKNKTVADKRRISKNFQKLREDFHSELKEHRCSYTVFIFLQSIVFVLFIFQLYVKNYESAFLCALTWMLLLLPSAIQIKFSIELPIVLEIVILIFIFAAEVLGEIFSFYTIFPFWDTILHTLNGFLCAAIGLSLVNILNKSEGFVFNVSPFFSALVAFCFSMTVGVLWEIFEYAMDRLFLLDMQKDTIINQISSVNFDPAEKNNPVLIKDINNVIINGKQYIEGGYLDIGLFDTMNDLIVNFFGAAVFSFIGFLYTKSKGKSRLAERFTPVYEKDKI